MNRGAVVILLSLLLACISARNHAVSLDNLDFGEPAQWSRFVYGSGPELIDTSDGFRTVLPANSFGTTQSQFGAQYDSTYSLHGDFNIEVDYQLNAWPPGNGARIGIGIVPWYGSQRVSEVYSSAPPADDAYVFVSGGISAVVPTSDLSGRLRLSRVDSTLFGYFWGGADWVMLGSGPVFTDDVHLGIGIWSHSGFFAGRRVEVEFSGAAVEAEAFIGLTAPEPPPAPVPEGGSNWILLVAALFTLQGIRRMESTR